MLSIKNDWEEKADYSRQHFPEKSDPMKQQHHGRHPAVKLVKNFFALQLAVSGNELLTSKLQRCPRAARLSRVARRYALTYILAFHLRLSEKPSEDNLRGMQTFRRI